MLKTLLEKLKESLISVLPVTLIVLLVSITPLTEFTGAELGKFFLCALALVLGTALFNLGADMAMTPMGEHIGTGLVKTGKLRVLLSVLLIMGVLITVAEPDLSVLAEQVSAVMNGTVLIVTVGIGVGLFLLISVLKIVFRKSLGMLLMLFYMLLFALAALLISSGRELYLPMAFDSGGVTTGPITVPFIMALGVGIASSVGGRNANENSFGLIALCSVGPILAVLVLALGAKDGMAYTLPDYSMHGGFSELLTVVQTVASEVALALGMIVVFFFILDFWILKLPGSRVIRIIIGIVCTFIGLVIFLSSVSVGFMSFGFALGSQLAAGGGNIVVVFGFIMGAVTVLAEPAVHVLNRQVEEITGGTVTKRAMLTALALGVGISIGLSMLRIVKGFSLLYYLIPGYFISLGLSLFVPKIYTAIAFDSGGVASGPLTSSFILPFSIGTCAVLQGESEIMNLAFGVVAMVAMTPLITIQILGFRAIAARAMRERIVMKRILDADDEQIIYFSKEGKRRG